MRSGAITPEELESLLEDGFVLGDRHALAGLFEADAVLYADPAAIEARGNEQITLAAGALCERGYSYLADSQRVLQAGNTTLVVAPANRGGTGDYQGSDCGHGGQGAIADSGDACGRSASSARSATQGMWLSTSISAPTWRLRLSCDSSPPRSGECRGTRQC